MKVWLFILLLLSAAGFGLWMEWYGERCQDCKDRKKKLTEFFGLNDKTKITAPDVAEFDPTKFGYDPNIGKDLSVVK